MLHQLIDRLQKLTGIDVLENYDPFAYDECLSRLLTQLKKQEKSVLVGIDDIKISDDIRAFASEYQILSAKISYFTFRKL